jgi:hypothetical protein
MKNRNAAAPVSLPAPLPAPAPTKSNTDSLLSGLLSAIKDADFSDALTIPQKPAEQSKFLRSAISSLRYAFTKVNLPERAANTYISKAEPALTTYSDTTLERIQNHPWSHEAASSLVVNISINWNETTVNDYMAAAVALNFPEGYGIDNQHADSWHLYPDLHPANNGGDYPAERLSQIVALYRVIEAMDAKDLRPYYDGEQTNHIGDYYLNDDNLREFVLHPHEPYKREDIVEIITTHDVFDPERIKAMLDNGTASLSSGVL